MIVTAIAKPSRSAQLHRCPAGGATPQLGITPAFVTQGGNVEVYGAEAELVARIHEQLTLNASASYNHSEVKSSASEPADVGLPLPATPKYKLAAFADDTLRKGPLGGLGTGFGARCNSKSTGALPGLFATPVIYAGTATLFDAMIHYDLPGWRFAVNGSNILDKKDVARCAGNFGCVYGAGQQIIGTVTKKF